MPRFSIIVPCFNAAETLQATLDSVRAQTFDDWEMICVDDASTDATGEILAAAAAHDPRICIRRQANAGPAVARNRAAAMATGDVLAFLDADDLWAATKLEELDRAFNRPDRPDGVYGRVAFFKSDPARPGATSSPLDRALQLRDLIGENPVCTMSNIAVTTKAWHRSGGMSADIVHAEDLEWLIRLVGGGDRLTGLTQSLTLYRANESGLSADLASMHAGWARAVQTAQRLDCSITDRDVARGEAVHLRYLARRALRTGQSPRLALSLALRGISRSAAGFFSSPRRGLLVLAGALIAPVLPAGLRRLSFQE